MFQHSGAQATSPLDFISKNLRTPTPQPQQEVGIQAPKQEVVQPLPAPETAPTEEVSFTPPVETAPDAPAEEAKALTPEEEFPELDDKAQVNDRFKTNWNKLRAAAKESKQKAKELAEAIAAREAELEEYKTGKKIPDALQNQEQEIATLRKYRAIVDLKASPEYQEKVKPLEEAKNRMEVLFSEYHIPLEELDKLRGKSLVEQNEFLEREFDHVAGLQIRNLLDTEKSVVQSLRAMEEEPVKELERLKLEAQRTQAVIRKQEAARIQSTFRDSWQRSLARIKEEGLHQELIYRPSDSKYNQTIVKPILEGAATEAGKFITKLYEAGLKELPDELADFISNMCLRGHSSALNANTREMALKYAKELEKNTERINSVARPAIGRSTGATATPAAPPERLTPTSMAQKLTQQITK